MKKNHRFTTELNFVNAPDWVRDKLFAMDEVMSGQGHSGGSHGVMIGFLRGWAEDLIPKTEPDSMLFELSKLLFELGIPEDRALVLDYFIKLSNHQPLSPLTGEDDEWMFHHCDEESAQNIRMGSVFKDVATGRVYWLDGRVFCNLSHDNSMWIGTGGYYSAVDITFPWLPPETEHVYYADEQCEVTLPTVTDPEGYKHAHFFKVCAGYQSEPYVIPKAFFVKPEDKDELVISFYQIVKATPDFSFPNKLKVLKEINRLTWSDEEDHDPDLMLELRNEYKGIWVCKRMIFPLLRLLACIPESATVNEDGEVCGYRNSRWEPEFQVPYCPTPKFQDWQPLKGQYAGYLSVRLDHNSGKSYHLDRLSKKEEVNKSYFDRVGYEIRFIDNDNYLWSMRRRFDIKHPPRKITNRPVFHGEIIEVQENCENATLSAPEHEYSPQGLITKKLK